MPRSEGAAAAEWYTPSVSDRSVGITTKQKIVKNKVGLRKTVVRPKN